MGSTREATTPPPTPAQYVDFYTYDPVQRVLHDDQKKRRGLNLGFGQLRRFHGCYVVSLAYAFRGYANNSLQLRKRVSRGTQPSLRTLKAYLRRRPKRDERRTCSHTLVCASRCSTGGLSS